MSTRFALKFWHSLLLDDKKATLSLRNLASRTLTACCNALPYSLRFRAAMMLSYWLKPFFHNGGNFLFLWRTNSMSAREFALRRILDFMNWRAITFAPKLQVNGFETVKSALDRGRGVLVITSHMPLNYLVIRSVYDRGEDPVIVSRERELRVRGTNKFCRIIYPSSTYMLSVRRELSHAGLVMSMIDQGEWGQRSEIVFDTANGQMRISDNLIKFAVNLGSEVLFTSSKLEGNKVVITFVSPSVGSRGNAQAITEEFIRFLQAHIAGYATKSKFGQLVSQVSQ
ncbi:MAG TPA: hypothetical protein VFC63_04280 [Blastocatellia bacterium]|nr:hypothetical protein [Blastocatellia bacterium]